MVEFITVLGFAYERIQGWAGDRVEEDSSIETAAYSSGGVTALWLLLQSRATPQAVDWEEQLKAGSQSYLYLLLITCKIRDSFMQKFPGKG